MLKKEDIKSIIKVGITLFLITSVSAFVLALVNGVTEPKILENTAQKQMLSMKKVLPLADEFLEVSYVTENKDISAVFEGISKDELSGYVVLVSPNGYGGKISMAVGITKDLKVSGVDIISQSETPGLGANCTKDKFKNQFIDKTNGIKVVKNNAKDNEIDAISSATVTSKAVTAGVNGALEAISKIKEDN